MCSRLWIFRQRNNGKVIFSLWNYTSTCYYFFNPTSDFFEQNWWIQLFFSWQENCPVLCFSQPLITGKLSRRVLSGTFLVKILFGEFLSLCRVYSWLGSNIEMQCNLSLALHLGAVLLEFDSRTTFLAQDYSGKWGLDTQLVFFSLFYHLLKRTALVWSMILAQISQ